MDRPRQRLDDDFKLETKPQGEALRSDVRKVIVGEEAPQGWSPDPDQEAPPEPPRVKEEQEELWTNKEGEQRRELQELTFTPVPLKKEDDDEEEKPQLHPIERTKTATDCEDCRGPKPDGHLQVHTDDGNKDSSETEVSYGDWEETSEPQQTVNSHKNTEVAVGDFNLSTVERSFSCSECGQRFGRKPHLNAHMRIHTGEKPYSCSFCGKRFSQKGNSTSHMRLHTGEKPFSCSICKKHFRYSGDVSRHMRIHTGKKTSNYNTGDAIGSERAGSSVSDGRLHPVSLAKPSETETRASDKNETEHLKSDEVFVRDPEPSCDKETLCCTECSRTFCRRDHLMSHMRTHTGEKPFSCSVCQKRFSCNGNILAHMRIHTGEKPFECSFCDKSFSQRGTLQLHVRIHTGEKPFSCPFCDKRFAHKRRMTLHMSVHTEEKRFGCDACQKRFTWYTQLKTHKCVGGSSQLRRNRAEKNNPPVESFSCTECGKQFSLKGNLKTHMRIHTGEKPFSCSVCGKGFKQNVHLTEHMTIHTGEKLYKCRDCGKGFNKRLLVKNHKCV